MQYNPFAINHLHAMTLLPSASVLYSNKIFIQHYLRYKTFFKIPSAIAVVEGHQTRLFLDPPQNARPPVEINIRVKHNVASNYKIFFFFGNFLFSWWLFVLDIPS